MPSHSKETNIDIIMQKGGSHLIRNNSLIRMYHRTPKMRINPKISIQSNLANRMLKLDSTKII